MRGALFFADAMRPRARRWWCAARRSPTASKALRSTPRSKRSPSRPRSSRRSARDRRTSSDCSPPVSRSAARMARACRTPSSSGWPGGRSSAISPSARAADRSAMRSCSSSLPRVRSRSRTRWGHRIVTCDQQTSGSRRSAAAPRSRWRPSGWRRASGPETRHSRRTTAHRSTSRGRTARSGLRPTCTGSRCA